MPSGCCSYRTSLRHRHLKCQVLGTAAPPHPAPPSKSRHRGTDLQDVDEQIGHGVFEAVTVADLVGARPAPPGQELQLTLV